MFDFKLGVDFQSRPASSKNIFMNFFKEENANVLTSLYPHPSGNRSPKYRRSRVLQSSSDTFNPQDREVSASYQERKTIYIPTCFLSPVGVARPVTQLHSFR